MARGRVRAGGPAGPVNESAKRGGERWIYEIADPGNGIDVRTALPLHKITLRSEKEISFVGEIAPEFIKCARFTAKWGWQGPRIQNPGFAGR
ncbi:hypothetical protein EV644_11652 [Kribbella orskensis]|uniref:Pierisin-like domain-containing protein n=1 Tax=Kribbella orskensis TaxID=2512216 RepID=A0ABY2BCZ5_9ACTN|nr:hypothetical protein EV642_11752 [Kribbella sp. VKM Ac-2500]TCO16681.1 hypothetical protein EV644_11652 [Kribbella orskensis]